MATGDAVKAGAEKHHPERAAISNDPRVLGLLAPAYPDVADR